MAIEAQSTSSIAWRRTPAQKEKTAPAPRAAPRLSFRRPVTTGDTIHFSSQLSLMLEVGTSLTNAMTALAAQTANPAFRAVIETMCDDMKEGRSFSEALSRHSRVFDGVYISMVQAGEAGGYLRETLDRIVEMQEKREALATKVKSALTYPTVLCVLAFGVVVFVLVGVLPKFMAFFQGKESILPLSTRILVAASISMRSYWWGYLLGAGGLAVGFKIFFSTTAGKCLRDRLILTLPVIRGVTNKICTTQLLRTLGHLMESHVSIIDALTMTRTTMGNYIYRGLVDRVEEYVRQGGRLAQAFKGFSYVTPAVSQMIATGEEAGNLYPVMLRLAKHFDAEIDQELKKLAALIEPLALVVLGSVVGFIVASVILPMFKLAQAIQ